MFYFSLLSFRVQFSFRFGFPLATQNPANQRRSAVDGCVCMGAEAAINVASVSLHLNISTSHRHHWILWLKSEKKNESMRAGLHLHECDCHSAAPNAKKKKNRLTHKKGRQANVESRKTKQTNKPFQPEPPSMRASKVTRRIFLFR